MHRILLALLLVTSAQAQLLTDPTGDVAIDAAGSPLDPPAGTFDAIDLVSLEVTETANDLHFTLGIADFPTCDDTSCTPDVGRLQVFFTHGKQYMVQMGFPLVGPVYGALWEGESERWIANLPVDLDVSTKTLSVTVARDHIRDAAGKPLMSGDAITDIHSRSRGHLSTGIGNQDGSVTYITRYWDEMGVDEPAVLSIMTGGYGGSGAFALRTDAPFRASNGGAMTLRYDITLQNRAEQEFPIDLVAKDLPAQWTFERPNGTLTLGPKETAEFPILITTPFGHRHGGAESFRLEASAGDEHAWVELGVHYVDVPQPSGHHQDLYFHGKTFMEPAPSLNSALGGASGTMWMHTLEEDAGADGEPIQGWIGAPGRTVANWSICLKPGLQMGIDMDLDDTGTLEATFSGGRAFTGVEVSGRVLHLGPGETRSTCFPSGYADREATVLAEIPASSAFDLIGSTQTVDLDIIPIADHERIAYQEGALLVVELRASYTGAGESGPEGIMLHQGAHMRLPLDEFHDSRPAGLVGGPATSAVEVVDFEEPVLDKESPGLPWVGALLALALVRRQAA